MVARVLAPKPLAEVPKAPPPPDPIAQAMQTIAVITDEASRINALLAERLGSKRQFINEVTARDEQGRIKSLRTFEQ
jgi:hypothetical protein